MTNPQLNRRYAQNVIYSSNKLKKHHQCHLNKHPDASHATQTTTYTSIQISRVKHACTQHFFTKIGQKSGMNFTQMISLALYPITLHNQYQQTPQHNDTLKHFLSGLFLDFFGFFLFLAFIFWIYFILLFDGASMSDAENRVPKTRPSSIGI